jgi:hypothetical protein
MILRLIIHTIPITLFIVVFEVFFKELIEFFRDTFEHIFNHKTSISRCSVIQKTMESLGNVTTMKSGFAVKAFPTPPTTPETVVNNAVCV